MVVESFGRIVTTVFEQKMKSSLLAGSWSILAMFLKYQPYGLDDIAHIGPFHRVKSCRKFRLNRTEFSRGLQYGLE